MATEAAFGPLGSAVVRGAGHRQRQEHAWRGNVARLEWSAITGPIPPVESARGLKLRPMAVLKSEGKAVTTRVVATTDQWCDSTARESYTDGACQADKVVSKLLHLLHSAAH